MNLASEISDLEHAVSRMERAIEDVREAIGDLEDQNEEELSLVASTIDAYALEAVEAGLGAIENKYGMSSHEAKCVRDFISKAHDLV